MAERDPGIGQADAMAVFDQVQVQDNACSSIRLNKLPRIRYPSSTAVLRRIPCQNGPSSQSVLKSQAHCQSSGLEPRSQNSSISI